MSSFLTRRISVTRIESMSWHSPPSDPRRSSRVEEARRAVGQARELVLDELARELAFYLGISPSTSAALAPTTERWVKEALRFFIVVVGLDPFDGRWFKYVTGIDFHKEVARQDLLAGMTLVAFESRPPGAPKPFLYFAEKGASPTRLGTNFASYQYVEYEVVSRVSALVSYASGIRFDEYDMVSRGGGARQFIVHAGGASFIRKRRTGALV